jgi:hypothetical protein|nr:hypothetical protein [Wansuia hejianensis]
MKKNKCENVDRERRTLKVKDASRKIKTSTRCLLVVGGNLK